MFAAVRGGAIRGRRPVAPGLGGGRCSLGRRGGGRPASTSMFAGQTLEKLRTPWVLPITTQNHVTCGAVGVWGAILTRFTSRFARGVTSDTKVRATDKRWPLGTTDELGV